MAGKPKPSFFVVLGLVVVALAVFGALSGRDIRPRRQRPKDAAHRSEPIGPKGAGQGRPEGGVARYVRAHHHGQGIQVPAGRAVAGDQRHLGLPGDGEQHGPLRPERLGRLGADHLWPTTASKPARFGRRPTARSSSVELVLIDDPVAMIATPTPRARFTSAGPRSTWCPCSSTAWSTAPANRRQPRHAPHLPAGRLVQRRRRHRGPREHQNGRRPARQEDRAGAELALAVLRC